MVVLDPLDDEKQGELDGCLAVGKDLVSVVAKELWVWLGEFLRHKNAFSFKGREILIK